MPSASIATKPKKGSFAHVGDNRSCRTSSLIPSILKPTTAISHDDTSFPRNDGPLSSTPSPHAHLSTSASLQRTEGTAFVPPPLAPCSMPLSPERSDAGSVSMDETMSTCQSLKSPEIEYMDNIDAEAFASLERRTTNELYISEHSAAESQGNYLLRMIFFFYHYYNLFYLLMNSPKLVFGCSWNFWHIYLIMY